MLSILRKPRPLTDGGLFAEAGYASDTVDSAHVIRSWRRRRRLPPTPGADEIDRGHVRRARRAIERAMHGFSEMARPALAQVRAVAGRTSWVGVTKDLWLTSIDVLVRRSTPQLIRLRGDIEDIEVSQAVIEMSKRVLIPTTQAVKRIRRRLKAYLGGMVGLEALVTGATLRAVGVEGGLLTTWPIAIATGAAIVLLGAACGGFVWPRLKRPGIAPLARWLIVLATAFPAAAAVYIAIAMGIVRATGSFEIEAIVKIIVTPHPRDLASIALTILNCGFFASAFWLTYRAKRDADDTYEAVVAVRSLLEQNREEDVETAQDLLNAIPAAAAATFTGLREEWRTELAQAQRGASDISAAWQTVRVLADNAIDTAEAAISRHREAVVAIWQPQWGCDVPAFYFETPDLRSVVEPVLAAAAASVASIRDCLVESEAADASVDATITGALAEIQAAVRQGIAQLDDAAYGAAAPPSSAPRILGLAQPVPPPSDGDDDALQSAP